MGLPPLRTEVPTGYEVVEGKWGRLVRLESEKAFLSAGGFGADGGECLEASTLGGRAPLKLLSGTNGTFLVKALEHGGLLRGLTGARFSDPERPIRELVLSAELRSAGIQTPEVIAARVRPAPVAGYLLDLVVRRVPASVDGRGVFHRLRARQLDAAARRALLTAVGDLVGRCHAAGLMHADLHPGNLLMEEEGLAQGKPSPWIIDLDRASKAEMTARQRTTQLARLERWIQKDARSSGACLGGMDRARFLRAYHRALDLARDERRSEARAITAALSRGRAAHTLGGWVESAYGE